MQASQVLYRFNSDDYFLHQLERMNNQLKELAVTIDANSRVQAVGRPPQYVIHQHQWRRVPHKRSPALIWPFSWLAAGIDSLLDRLIIAVGRFVAEGFIARWLNRMRFWLMKRKRA